jgi:hypothetical protein
MDKKEAMTKLQKLMALSKSSNPNEATVAIDKANKLKEQFGITDRDFITQTEFLSEATRLPVWQKMFMGAVSDLYCTVAVISQRRNQNTFKKETFVSFTGEDLDVFFSKEMYDYLAATMNRAKKAAWYSKDLEKRVRGKQAVNNFAVAFAQEVCQRLRAMGDNASWAPQRKDKISAANKWLVEKIGRELQVSRHKTFVRGRAGLAQGFAAGSEVNLGKQVNGAAAQLSIGT